MSRIRGKDTRPELLLRRALHTRGLRYRLNVCDLPGRPDLVFPARRAVIFMHGCFWHQHDCDRFKWPKTRKAFWTTKLNANVERDARVLDDLDALGWRTLVVWECALTGPQRMPIDKLAALAADFVAGERTEMEITGAKPVRLRRISAR